MPCRQHLAEDMTGNEREELDRLIAARRFAEARAACDALLANSPQELGLLYIAGMLAADAKDLPAAARCFFRVLELAPGEAPAYLHLGNAYMLQKRLQKAAACYRKALELEPAFAEAANKLGFILAFYLGEAREGVAALRRATALEPDYDDPRVYLKAPFRREGPALGQSTLLFALSYNVLCSPAQLLEEHREWDRRFGGPGRAARCTHVPPPADDARGQDKPLRIGYVSPDLRRHAVSYFFEPLLAAHDRRRVEVYCYAEVGKGDEVTERLKAQADHWRVTVGQGDAEVARQIFEDGIDILVDLAGHTAGNRLQVFTYKPAPIQVSYLGYCTTTGLEAMDYWITDAVVTPEDTVERTTETIWRLPRCWLCYRPDPGAEGETPAVAPRPGPSPIEAAVTFGSFNQVSKISEELVALWSEVLNAVPGSRLVLKAWALSDEQVCATLRERFMRHGIAAERLEFRGVSTDYLREYGDVDIALDPFPRTGGATTADALWMGVPVVTLAGERMIERQGASLLSAVGLDELIATDRADYVARAVALAQDPERRATLRAQLRERMVASELCDGRGLATALEDAYRDMWNKYVGRET